MLPVLHSLLFLWISTDSFLADYRAMVAVLSFEKVALVCLQLKAIFAYSPKDMLNVHNS
jgi:hypothetical protein